MKLSGKKELKMWCRCWNGYFRTWLTLYFKSGQVMWLQFLSEMIFICGFSRPATLVILLNLFRTLPWWTKPATVSLLLRMVRDIIRAPIDDDVRVAIFRPTFFQKSLVEVVISTAAGEQQRKNRARMKISQGIAGRAYRTRELCCVPITGDLYDQFMRDFGFTNQEVSRFRSDRKSYLCIPILGEHQKVIAILSFDSKYPDTFTSDRITWIEYMAPYFSVALRGE